MYRLSLVEKYPMDEYNFLGNTDVIVDIPDIQKPVIQIIKLNPDPDKGDVYKLQGKLAITKNGLKKLADGAGIKTIASEHVLPASCQKCAAVNRSIGKVVQCGTCGNRDVAFCVTIGVPQLTGEVLTVTDTNEIIVESATKGMTDRQKNEFMKFLPQICEAKALNGAIRTALHIKGTYTREEIERPFIVAYLIPNMDNEDVKKAAISNMFSSTAALFGKAPSVERVEGGIPEEKHIAIEAADGENVDRYIDGTCAEVEETAAEEPKEATDRGQDLFCDRCGSQINERVWDYSVEHYGRPLCMVCQRAEKGGAR